MSPKPVTTSKRAGQLVDQLTSTQRVLTRGLAARFEDEGTTVEQWRILRALTGTGGVQMGELAVVLEMPHPTLTRLVDGMVESANLYRTQSSEDRRRVSVHLSNRGGSLLERLDAIADDHEKSLRSLHGDAVVDRLSDALSAFTASQ